METQYQQQLTLFLDCINESARKTTERIIKEADDLISKELEKAKEDAEKKSLDYIKYESEKLKIQANRHVSEANSMFKKQLIEQRSNIVSSVFKEVTEKLNAFTNTEEYKDFLLQSAKKMAFFYKDADFVLFVKSSDMKHKDFLIENVRTLSDVQADSSIQIGGCKSMSKNSHAELDDTLDTRLENEKPWFYENSKLSI